MEQQDIDKKLEQLKKSNRKSGMIYTLIPLGIIFTLLMVFWSNLEERDRQLDQKEAELNKKEKELEEQETKTKYFHSQLAKVEAEKLQIQDEVQQEVEKLEEDYHHNVDLDTSTLIYQQIQQKNHAQIAIKEFIEEKPFDRQIKILYHNQESDGGKVIDVFTKLGLKKKENYEVLPSHIKNNIGPVNSIRYGSKVDLSSLKILTLELINSGFEFRAVEPYANDTGKENAITIYRNSYILNNPVLTPDDVTIKIKK